MVHWPEMERLVEGLSNATTGKGGCYGICGPVGVGKTYLLRKLESTAGGLGFSVQKCSCEPGAGPKTVFASLLGYSENLPEAEHPLFLLGRLEELAGLGPVLMTIEDLHLADPQVIPVLILMARNLGEKPVMIAFTCNRDLVSITGEDVHPLVSSLRVLLREGAYEEIFLEAMSRSSLLSLVEEEIMGELDPSLSDLIWERCEGNPMVATEALRLLIQANLVQKIKGIWTPLSPVDLELPDGYRAIMESRVKMLPQDDMELLAVAAVVGRNFDPWIIAMVQKRRPLDVLEQLDKLARDHHLLEEDGDRYRFVSGSTWRIILDNIAERRVKELHYQIAKALELTALEQPFDELAEHYYRAGARERCACFSLLAAEKHIREHRLEDALRELEKVLDASADGSYPEERRYAKGRMAEVRALMRI